MMVIVWTIGSIAFASFLLIVLRGAPFVPTRQADVTALFDLHQFQAGDVFVDLGSGDGRMIIAAAQRGIRAVGYELNPFLVAYTWLRVRGLHPRPTVRWRDFWATPLPEHTAVVFVFLAGPFMKRLDRRLQAEADLRSHDLTLISYGMRVPGREPVATSGAYLVFRYQPSRV